MRHTKFDNRTRFNWGYHDARADVSAHIHKELRDYGTQSLKVVSKSFDAAYYDGYRLGLMPAYAQDDTSNRAWEERKSI